MQGNIRPRSSSVGAHSGWQAVHSRDTTQDEKILRCLHVGFEQGLRKFYKISSSIKNMPCFTKISEQVITELIGRGNNNFIKIETDKISFTIKEKNHFLVLSVNKLQAILFNNSLKKLFQHFLIDILNDNFYYPDITIDHTLHYVLIEAQNADDAINEATCRAILYMSKEFDCRIRADLKFAALKHVLKYHAASGYSKQDIRPCAEMVIQRWQTYPHSSVMQMANYILNNESDYPEEAITCAVIVISLNTDRCSNLMLKLAAKHIINDDYPRQLGVWVAQEFIERNNSFFTDPCTRQDEFVKFFSENKKMSSLQDYSNHLMNILCSINKKIIIKGQDHERNIYRTLKAVTVLSLWIAGDFEYALKQNSELVTFILNNMEHEAIIEWNIRNTIGIA